MTPEATEQPVVKDAVWEAWLEKGRRNDRATARKFKVAAGIAFPLVIFVLVYLNWLK